MYHTGTTIVGVCCTDGVVLGADTKSTAGTGVADSGTAKLRRIFPRALAPLRGREANNSTIDPITDTDSPFYIGCGGAGVSADCEQACLHIAAALESLSFDASLTSRPNQWPRLPPNMVHVATRAMADALHTRSDAKVSCSMLLGGCGASKIKSSHPSLYRISSGEGEAAVQLPFGAVGSGAADALAALEAAGLAKRAVARPDGIEGTAIYCNITVAEAIGAVRDAVRAGICNDLGSGFHVDLMAMTATGRRVWRELCVVNTNSNSSMKDNRFSTDSRRLSQRLSEISFLSPENGWYAVWNATTGDVRAVGASALEQELHRVKTRKIVPVTFEIFQK